MTTEIHVRHASEICDHDGPTGEFAEVLAGEVCDWGGNVLFAGTPDDCVREQAKYRIPTGLVPTKTRKLADGERIAGADVTWCLS